MPGTAIAKLITAGPFTGVDVTTADIYVKPTMGVSMTNGTAEVVPGALIAEKGRTVLVNFNEPLADGTTLYGGGTAPPAFRQILPGAIQVAQMSYGTDSEDYLSNPGQVLIASVTTENSKPFFAQPARAYWISNGVSGTYPVNSAISEDFPNGAKTSATLPFTESVQMQSGASNSSPEFVPFPLAAVYDNYGCITYAGTVNVNNFFENSIYQSHYNAPQQITIDICGQQPPTSSATITAGAKPSDIGATPPGTYSYAFTYVYQSVFGDIRETSPLFWGQGTADNNSVNYGPTQIVVGSSNSVYFSSPTPYSTASPPAFGSQPQPGVGDPSNPPNCTPFGVDPNTALQPGSSDRGIQFGLQSGFTINVYRSSTTQPTYFLDPYIHYDSGTGLYYDYGCDNAASTGYNANYNQYGYPSGNNINTQAQLTYNRDPAPVKCLNDFPGALSGYDSGLVNYFPGAPMCAHQERLWYFALVSNKDTNNQAQLQLWYSNSQRPWEFDKVNNVFLIDIPTTPLPLSNRSIYSYNDIPLPIDIYQYPYNLNSEVPSGMISLGSVLLFWSTERMYRLYGTGSATYFYQKIADLGCSSMNSVAYAATEQGVGAFWMTEHGVYFTDGNSIAYVGEPIRSLFDSLSTYDRYNCVGFFRSFTYYISFPNLNQTWAYRTTSKEWHGPISYACSYAVSTPVEPGLLNISPETPNPYTGQGSVWNQVVAVDNSFEPNLNPQGVAGGYVSQWFTQTDLDYGNPVTVTFQTSAQITEDSHMEKEFTHVGITHVKQNVPYGTLFCTVTVTIDRDPSRTCTVTFDLAKGPVQIGTLSYSNAGQSLRGYMGAITLSYTTVANNPTAPVTIDSVVVYGRNISRELVPTLNLVQ